MRIPSSLTALVAIICLILTGCGDRRATVSGKVSVEGKGPLTGGAIQFISVKDPNLVGGGSINADGTYTVTDAPVGECKVIVDNSHLDPKAIKSGGGGLTGAFATGGGPAKGPGGKGGPPQPKAPPNLASKSQETLKGAPIPGEMSAGKPDVSNMKYIPIDPSYAKAESTQLKFTVKSGSNSHDFSVK